MNYKKKSKVTSFGKPELNAKSEQNAENDKLANNSVFSFIRKELNIFKFFYRYSGKYVCAFAKGGMTKMVSTVAFLAINSYMEFNVILKLIFF